MSIADIFNDPQFQARDTIATVEHPVLGQLKMQNVIPRLLSTPGSIRSCGPDLGAHNRDILGNELGYSESELVRLGDAGVIAPLDVDPQTALPSDGGVATTDSDAVRR